jgi:hypothetical protein
MKKQVLKMMVLCLLGISISTTLKAQQYEGTQEENYNDDALEQSFDYQVPAHSQAQFYQVNTNLQTQASNEQQYNNSIVYPMGSRVSNENSGSAIGGIPDPPPDTPIDSNLYVLFFAALCYGVYQRKRLSSLVVSD